MSSSINVWVWGTEIYDYCCWTVSFNVLCFASCILVLCCYIYFYNCYIFFMNWPLVLMKCPSVPSSISCLKVYFIWYWYSHFSSLMVTVCIISLLAYFYFQPMWVLNLWYISYWQLRVGPCLFMQVDNPYPLSRQLVHSHITIHIFTLSQYF